MLNAGKQATVVDFASFRVKEAQAGRSCFFPFLWDNGRPNCHDKWLNETDAHLHWRGQLLLFGVHPELLRARFADAITSKLGHRLPAARVRFVDQQEIARNGGLKGLSFAS